MFSFLRFCSFCYCKDPSKAPRGKIKLILNQYVTLHELQRCTYEDSSILSLNANALVSLPLKIYTDLSLPAFSSKAAGQEEISKTDLYKKRGIYGLINTSDINKK